MNLAAAVKNIEFCSLITANPEMVERLRIIRNEPEVRKNMYTTHEISGEEHRRWVGGLGARDDRAYFAVLRSGEVVGGVGYYGLDRQHRRADWAYYLTSSAQGSGLGSALEFKFLDAFFASTSAQKLNCEVIGWNAAVIKLHKRFGFLEEGSRRQHVWRDGAPYNATLLGLTSSEWSETRRNLMVKLFAGAPDPEFFTYR